MKSRPILFSGPMVRALLGGTKTQTRRVVNPKHLAYMDVHQGLREPTNAEVCPYGQPGDQLWVRETWNGPLIDYVTAEEANDLSVFENPKHCEYAADGGPAPEYIDADDNIRRGWKPSIHMPRWASRITLEITGVRVERLQVISEADALSEGITSRRISTGDARTGCRSIFGLACDNNAWAGDAKQAYQSLWESINGDKSWDSNPWVWVVEFKKVVP